MKNKTIDFLHKRLTFITIFCTMIVLIKLYHVFLISIEGRYFCISYLSFLMTWEFIFNSQLKNILLIVIVYVVVFTYIWVYLISLLLKSKLWYLSWILMILYIIVFLLDVIDTNKLGF